MSTENEGNARQSNDTRSGSSEIYSSERYDSANDVKVVGGSQDQVVEEIIANRVDANAEVITDRGVYRVEALKKLLYSHENGLRMRIILGVSVLLCSWAISLDWSVTSNLRPWATSDFEQHSMGLGALSVAVQLITAISKPVWARTANIVSRPATYLISLIFYVLGYIIVASSTTISAYIAGSALSAAGESGVEFLSLIIVADMTSLKWRALATSTLSTPYIINTWYAGHIVSDLGPTGWRWGYGMFCIIVPVVLAPATTIMFYYENKAQKSLDVSEKGPDKDIIFKKNWKKLVWRVLVEVDILGLLLLGFAFALILLPFSLYRNAENQWRNPSLIAMLVVGGVLLISFFIYEFVWAPFPILPRRCVNRTLVGSIIITFFFQLAGMVPLTYLSSYVWIVKDWSNQEWTYYNNTLTMALCVFGVVSGTLMRVTHSFKIYQYFGIVMEIIGSGIMIDGRLASDNTVILVWSSILSGMGGGFTVPACNVSLQASVPHRDMAISISIMSLASNIGSSIGSTISTAIWQGQMETSLRAHMPSHVTDEEIKGYFNNITNLEGYEFNSAVRQAGIQAYREVNFYFYPIAVSLQAIRLAAAYLQRSYYLGETNNAVEDDDGVPIPLAERKMKAGLRVRNSDEKDTEVKDTDTRE